MISEVPHDPLINILLSPLVPAPLVSRLRERTFGNTLLKPRPPETYLGQDILRIQQSLSHTDLLAKQLFNVA
jgi:hypothetical protein